MRIVRSDSALGKRAIMRLSERGTKESRAVATIAGRILSDVRRNGDAALRKHAAKLDSLPSNVSFRVSAQEMSDALVAIKRDDPAFLYALKTAARNIRRFAEWQKPKEWTREYRPGIRVGQVTRPLNSVGCYVPGGRYPLPSTLLMTVIPAQVAGVRRIVVVSPKPAPQTLAAAALLGVTEFYRIGGAQAVGALAYGTRSIPRVDKIVGPGNSYVTAAKKMCDCPIDMLAGPTEALIVSHSGDPAFIAADLVAQAEHDVETSTVFITSSAKLGKAVAAEADRLSADNSTARRSLRKNGVVIVARSRKEAMQIANEIASEHLTVESSDISNVRAAGSLFVGDHSAQAVGDYLSGPNHVLPTGGLARARGGLSVTDFLKIITVQQISSRGLNAIGKGVVRLAQAEGLHGHAQSVSIRMGGARA